MVKAKAPPESPKWSCSLEPSVLGPHWEPPFNPVRAGGASSGQWSQVCPRAEMTGEMLWKVLETLPSSLSPKRTLCSSCEMGTMSCATNLAVNAQVMGAQRRDDSGEEEQASLPAWPTPGLSASWLHSQDLKSVRPPDPHPLLQGSHGVGSFPP